MTEKEYYLWSNKFNNWFIHVIGAAFLTKIYIAAFVFEFCNSILTKQNRLYKLWNASCQWKQIKMEEAFGGFEFDLTEMCFPSPGLGTYV